MDKYQLRIMAQWALELARKRYEKEQAERQAQNDSAKEVVIHEQQ